MPDNNTELWTKEAEMYFDICADFLARMIMKYGHDLLAKIEKAENNSYKE